MSDRQGDWSGPPSDPGIKPGTAVRLSKYVWRLTAGNAGRMTGPGTNSYLVGAGSDWSIIDPGPADDRHIDALIGAASGKVRQILVTHTHVDHSPGAAPLKAATRAPLLGQTTTHPHWQDPTFTPDRELHHHDRVPAASGATLRVIHTPGHASNHLCFLLEEEAILFTGDHIMQGTTPVIDPPDGDMTAYIRSLESLLHEPLDYLAPGHGTLMPDPESIIRTLIKHRLWREAKVLASLQGQPEDLPTLVRRAYEDVSVQLHTLAQRSLLAHLLKLESEGRARRSVDAWMGVDVAAPTRKP